MDADLKANILSLVAECANIMHNNDWATERGRMEADTICPLDQQLTAIKLGLALEP